MEQKYRIKYIGLMGYVLSNRSLSNLIGVNKSILEIVKRSIKITDTDFGIIQNGGFRTAEMQNELYKLGVTNCDGFKIKSYHQSGNAVDLVPYVNGRFTWSDRQALIDVLYAFVKSEKELKKEGVIPDDVFFHHGIYWNWADLNNDGKLTADDKLGWDACHHEMRDEPQTFQL